MRESPQHAAITDVWTAVLDTLGPELTARLVLSQGAAVAPPAGDDQATLEHRLTRYATGVARTPEAVADRLRFVATINLYIRGSYDKEGQIGWWQRGRSAFEDQTARPARRRLSPVEHLGPDWSPADKAASDVEAIAYPLTGGGIPRQPLAAPEESPGVATSNVRVPGARSIPVPGQSESGYR